MIFLRGAIHVVSVVLAETLFSLGFLQTQWPLRRNINQIQVAVWADAKGEGVPASLGRKWGEGETGLCICAYTNPWYPTYHLRVPYLDLLLEIVRVEHNDCPVLPDQVDLLRIRVQSNIWKKLIKIKPFRWLLAPGSVLEKNEFFFS